MSESIRRINLEMRVKMKMHGSTQKPGWVLGTGTGVAIGGDIFGYSFGNRVKGLHLIPEPKPISIGIIGPKGRLSPAAEKFWQCAKEAASPAARPKALDARR